MLACLSISRVQLFVMDAGRIYHPSSSTSKSWPNTAAIGSPLNTDYRIQKSSQRIADSMFNYLLPSSLAARFLRLSVRARSLSTITHYPKEFLFPRRFEPCKNPPSEIPIPRTARPPLHSTEFPLVSRINYTTLRSTSPRSPRR